jgi:hypothetical protein
MPSFVPSLRWTVAFSLTWPSIEKLLYPGWVAQILAEHPELGLAFDAATVITGAGVVEIRSLLCLVLVLDPARPALCRRWSRNAALCGNIRFRQDR